MRVLIIHNSGRKELPSGELAVVNNEVEALRNKGVTVHLHVVNNDSLRLLFPFKAIIAGLNSFWSYSSFCRTKELIDTYRPDIVHFHGVLPLLTPSAFHACKKKGVPVVQTLHNFRWVCVEGGLFRNNHYCEICIGNTGWRGVLYGCSKGSRLISFPLWLVNLFYRKSGLLYSWVDRFIAVSGFVRDKYIEAGFPAKKIQFKYNAAPLFLDCLQPVKASERSGVTFVGRIAPAKGTRIIKEIIQNIELPVNIIGSGPDLTDLKQYCREYDLSHVKFWGQIPHKEVLEIISLSQCVVVPSVCGETFSLVAVEAMACGTPVIASNLGGVVELINKSRGGITVDADEPGAFVEAIYELTKHPERIEQMGLAGRRYTGNSLSEEIITDRLMSIYREVIDEKRAKM